MRTAPDPNATLLEFLQSTYDAAADSAAWDRTALDESSEGSPGSARNNVRLRSSVDGSLPRRRIQTGKALSA